MVAGRWRPGEGSAECGGEGGEETCPVSALFSVATCHLDPTASTEAWNLLCGPHVTSNLTLCFQKTFVSPSPAFLLLTCR